MTDEELVKRLRGWAKDIQEGSTAIYAMDLDLKEAADRIEALTEQLEAARADAKEAEAYAEELEKEIELNEQEACMLENDLIKADKEIDNLKVKLAKAVEGLNYCINAPFSGWTIAQGYARATLAEIESSEAVTLGGEK